MKLTIKSGESVEHAIQYFTDFLNSIKEEYPLLNTELKEKGYLTISGRINKQYFLERTCYGKTNEFRKE